ncbi:MAG: hypothetical protein JST19_19875 [Bacteroidetes bacterium]|nr:hypothetical protein [Bacteroidota bacterium]
MKRSRVRLFVTALMLSAPFALKAQVTDCPQFPAPCPHSAQITEAMNAAGRMADNKVTEQEINMEASLRNTFTDLLQNIGRKHHWQVYELTESSYDRPDSFIGFTRWEATPYEKRPPHAYEISFMIIVNKDSLQAWRDWYTGDLQQQANQAVSDIKNDQQKTGDDKVLQSLTDSVQYYAQLSAKYMQDHYTEFAAAIQNNDQKAQKRYNDQITMYQKKQDAIMKKMQDRSNADYSASANSYDRLQKDQISKTEQFVNASVLLVHFAVNQSLVGFGLSDGGQRSISPQHVLKVAGAYYAGLLKNPSVSDRQSYLVNEYDYLYDHPSYVATVLYGKWLSQRTSFNLVQAAYRANSANTNLTTIKPVKCDKVQNFAIHLEGRPDYIRQVLNELDTGALEKLSVQ